MARVSARDYEGILEVVALAAGGSPREPLTPEVLAAIRRLIPSDTVAFFEGPPHDRSRRRIWVDGVVHPWSRDDIAAHDRFRFQLPLWPSPATVGRATRLSDVMSQRAYRNLDLYQLIGRPRGIDYSLAYWMHTPDGIVRGLAFDSAGCDFSQRDLDVLEILGRHLGVTLGHADPRLPRRSSGLGLTERQAEVLGLVAQGRTNSEIAAILSLSPNTVRKHLENAFERINVHTRGEAIAAIYRDEASRSDDYPPRSAISPT